MKIAKKFTMDVVGNASALKVFVVMGADPHTGSRSNVGKIKTITVSPTRATNGIFACEWTKGAGGRINGIKAVHLYQEFVDAGWLFLEDAYRSEGDTEGLEAWLDWADACATKRARGPVREGGKTVFEGHSFPDEMLPKSVLELRKTRSTHTTVGSYEPPKRASSKARKSA